MVELYPNPRGLSDVADISSFHPMLSYDPELSIDMPVAHWSTPRLACLAANGFKQSVSGRDQADSKEQLDR